MGGTADNGRTLTCHGTQPLLRAINVGGHNVKMDRLRELLVSLGFANVETFIASGNVIFDPHEDPQTLIRKITNHLGESPGYGVDIFLRRASELASISRCRPFDQSMTYRTEVDDFPIRGCEVYWLCRKKMSEPSFSGALLEKALGMPATMRTSTTVGRIAAEYPRTRLTVSGCNEAPFAARVRRKLDRTEA